MSLHNATTETLQLNRSLPGLRTQRLSRTPQTQPLNRRLGMPQARARRREVPPVVRLPVDTLHEGLPVAVVRVDYLEAEALAPVKGMVVIRLAQRCPQVV